MSAAQHHDSPPIPPERLTRMVMTLFTHWQLTQSQQANLLGLSENTRSTINRYRSGQQAFSSARDLQDRVKHLLAIHEMLRTLFPKNKELVYDWPTRKNRYFENFTPIEIIEREGFAGLLRVRDYLQQQVS